MKVILIIFESINIHFFFSSKCSFKLPIRDPWNICSNVPIGIRYICFFHRSNIRSKPTPIAIHYMKLIFIIFFSNFRFMIFRVCYWFWAKREMYWCYYDVWFLIYFYSLFKTNFFIRNLVPIFMYSIFSKSVLDLVDALRRDNIFILVVVFLIIGKKT